MGRFRNAQCTGEFQFEHHELMQRDRTKVIYEVRFRAPAWDDFRGSFDEEAFDEANQEWLRGIEGVNTVDSVDDIEEAAAREARLPALFTMDDGARSEGRDAPQDRGQRIEPRCSVLCVTSSMRSKKDGRIGALRLVRLVKNRMIGEEV
jgi:hypothetical protein